MLAAAYFRFEENEMSTTTIANPDEFMDAESFAELGEAAAANTVIDYMYRDGSNWKTRSEEHTSELQSLMRISYAVFCLKKKILKPRTNDVKQNYHKKKLITDNNN